MVCSRVNRPLLLLLLRMVATMQQISNTLDLAKVLSELVGCHPQGPDTVQAHQMPTRRLHLVLSHNHPMEARHHPLARLLMPHRHFTIEAEVRHRQHIRQPRPLSISRRLHTLRLVHDIHRLRRRSHLPHRVIVHNHLHSAQLRLVTHPPVPHSVLLHLDVCFSIHCSEYILIAPL